MRFAFRVSAGQRVAGGGCGPAACQGERTLPSYSSLALCSALNRPSPHPHSLTVRGYPSVSVDADEDVRGELERHSPYIRAIRAEAEAHKERIRGLAQEAREDCWPRTGRGRGGSALLLRCQGMHSRFAWPALATPARGEACGSERTVTRRRRTQPSSLSSLAPHNASLSPAPPVPTTPPLFSTRRSHDSAAPTARPTTPATCATLCA